VRTYNHTNLLIPRSYRYCQLGNLHTSIDRAHAWQLCDWLSGSIHLLADHFKRAKGALEKTLQIRLTAALAFSYIDTIVGC
jgi:hypothetical protein